MNSLNIKITPSKKFLIFLLSFLLGLVVSSYYYLPLDQFFILLFSSLFIIIFFSDEKIISLALIMLAISLAFLYNFWFQSIAFKNVTYGPVEKNFIVIDQPIQKNNTQKVEIKDDMGKYLLYTELMPQYELGDELRITGAIEKPPDNLDFDYESYLRRYGIRGIIYYPKVLKIGENKGSPLLKSIIFSKQKFVSSITATMSHPESVLSTAILIGNRDEMPENLKDNFKNAGLSHIVAVSGYNITILIAIVWCFLGYFGRKPAFIITTIISTLFVIITGAESSIVRGAIIAEIILFARFVGRKPNQLILIFLAAFLMSISNPLILKSDIGFRLSFLAFVGLIYLSPIIKSLVQDKIPKILKDPLSETLAAQIFTLPIILSIAKQISLFSIVANMLILPMIPLSMLVAFIHGALAMINSILGQIIGYFDWFLMHYIIKMSDFFGNLQILSLKFTFKPWLVFTYYLLLVLWIIKKTKDEKTS